MSDPGLSVFGTHDDRRIRRRFYEIDRAHTSVEFVARHLMITKVRGRFTVIGQITIAEEPEGSHVEVEIAAARLDTGNSDRDAHLRSADFFDVDRYPVVSFRSTAVRAPLAGWEVIGDLRSGAPPTRKPIPARPAQEHRIRR